MKKLENLHNYEDFVNENLFKKLGSWISKGIGNQKVDEILKHFKEELMSLNNQWLVSRYGQKVKDHLFKTGENFDKIAKEIGSETGKEIATQYREAINNFKKTINPEQEGDKFYIINPKTKKQIKISERMVKLIRLRKNQIELEINKANIEKLKAISKGGDIDVSGDVKDLQNASKQMTSDIEKINKDLKSDKSDEQSKETKVEKGRIYKYKNKDDKYSYIVGLDDGQAKRISQTYDNDIDSVEIKDLVKEEGKVFPPETERITSIDDKKHKKLKNKFFPEKK
jgi:hypothetical protein